MKGFDISRLRPYTLWRAWYKLDYVQYPVLIPVTNLIISFKNDHINTKHGLLLAEHV